MAGQKQLNKTDVISAGAHADRTARVDQAARWGVSSRFCVTLVNVAASGIIAHELDATNFGVFATLSTIPMVLGFADLGIGNSLVNRLATSLTEGDREQSARISSAALLISSLAAVALAALFVGLILLTPILSLLGLSFQLRGAVAIYGCLILFCVPLSLSQRIMSSLQRGRALAICQLAATSAGAIPSAFLAWTGQDVRILLFAAGAGPALIYLLVWVDILRRHPQLRPTLRLVNAAVIKDLARPAGLFLVLNLVIAAAYQADVMVVSALLGPAAAGTYSLAARVAALMSMGLQAANAQLWPAYREALGLGDIHWIRETLRGRTRRAVNVTSLAGIGVIVAGPLIITVWAGPDQRPTLMLMSALVAWNVEQSVLFPNTMLLNAAEQTRCLLLTSVGMGVVNVILSIVLTRQVGVSGPAWGSLVSHLAVAAGPQVLAGRRLLRDVSESPRGLAHGH